MLRRIIALGALVAFLLAETGSAQFATLDLFDGPGCNQTQFFRRDTAQTGVCFWQQQDGPVMWECAGDGSLRRWVCSNCSVACTPENGATYRIYYAGCINAATGVGSTHGFSYRVTCGQVPEVPSPHNDTMGVVLKTFNLNNTACNDSAEPGILHSASWYRGGYCQFDSSRNRIHNCERGYPELYFYNPDYDGCLVNFQVANLSTTCGTMFQNRRFWSCGNANFAGLVPLAPQDPITSTVTETAAPETPYYATVEFYYGTGCNATQLFSKNSRRIGFCDSFTSSSVKTVCTDFGVREYFYQSNTSCTGPSSYRDSSSSCSPTRSAGVQFSTRAFCSAAPTASTGSPTGYTLYRYNISNTICNRTSAQQPHFDDAMFFRAGCMIPPSGSNYGSNSTHVIVDTYNSSATSCSDPTYIRSTLVRTFGDCLNESRTNGFVFNSRWVAGLPDFSAQIYSAPIANANSPAAANSPVAANPPRTVSAPMRAGSAAVLCFAFFPVALALLVHLV